MSNTKKDLKDMTEQEIIEELMKSHPKNISDPLILLQTAALYYKGCRNDGICFGRVLNLKAVLRKKYPHYLSEC